MTDPRILEIKDLLPRCMLYDWVRLGSRLGRVIRDRHHLARHGPLLDRLLERARTSVRQREWRGQHRLEIRYAPDLPVSARKDEILNALRSNQVIVVAGETGSGKTTQLPKICLEARLGVEARIGCTQPRRVAALSVSRRIAEELGVQWGREVGCKIRFDDRSSPETFIKLMTDGILLAEVQGDPLLSEYNAIVLDEAHERSLNIDFLLGHLKTLLARRSDLKLIITSATIDTAAFAKAFNDAPIIEVSGRTFPVEVLYRPIDTDEEEQGEVSYVDAAVTATRSVLADPGGGDVLIFLPTERDIRETSDALENALGTGVEIIPLFARLGSSDQQRAFAVSNRRKIIVATNIAETSLTIPGIRYVIDSGLARISRYNPRTRTRRLPIEPISRSSANQRKGRAGRVEAGICIRLYSEEDYNDRAEFTQPEIQRANLAEVILRMKAFHLGNIEDFPFLNPPSPAAIQAGYALLFELGAVDAQKELTDLGRDLARLPIDPTLGRMLLQAQHEHATRELLIIASGLSIQDPRERPMDQQAAADATHRKYAHPRSDFLTLLNIWNAVHDEWESLRTQNQRRKFCRAHFLSYNRMREWQDLHAQLDGALEELGALSLSESSAAYEAVHRSILTGLLAHVSRREGRNQYLGRSARQMMLFPGSVLFQRGEPPKGRAEKAKGPPTRTDPASRQPLWVVAGEIVETSQLFARTVASIDPQWIVELAPHLIERTHQRPHWSPRSGRVLVEEVTTLFGLEVARRKIGYGAIHPDGATEVFIREALVAGRLAGEEENDGDEDVARRGPRRENAERSGRRPTVQSRANLLPPHYAFLEHNHRLRQRVEDWQTRTRRHDLGDLDETLFKFYGSRLSRISSRDELNRWLRDSSQRESLFAVETDLTGGGDIAYDAEAFPDTIRVGGQPVAVEYAYAPGEEHDGVTIRVPFTLADAVSPILLEWSVPGLREAKAEELLRGLPKALRVPLLPVGPKAAEIAREFRPEGPSFVHELSRFVHERYGVLVPPASWPVADVATHLRARIEVLGQNSEVLAATRDLAEARTRAASTPAPSSSEDRTWQTAVQQWERFQLTGWTFGDLPDRIQVGNSGGLPRYAWAGLDTEGQHVHLRLFATETAARQKTQTGFRRLVETALAREFAWMRKDLRGLSALEPLYAALGDLHELEETAYQHLSRYALPSRAPDSLRQSEFDAAVAATQRVLPGLVANWIPRVREILQLRLRIAQRLGGGAAAIARSASPASPQRVIKDLSQLGRLVPPSPKSQPPAAPAPASPGMAELENLVPPRFLEFVDFERLKHLPRYLRALELRLERASVNPARDRERTRQLAPYLDFLKSLGGSPASEEKRTEIEKLRWMIEEFRVSLFAQELGTSMPISAKRLDEQVNRIRMLA